MSDSSASVDEQLRILRTGAVDVITEADFRRKLGTGRSLRIKLGIDPTASDIHLGFAVVLRKLRQFQDFGHTAVLVVGGFTGQVGDPSGRTATRVAQSADQVMQFLDPERAEVVNNADWLGTMQLAAMLGYTRQVTVAQLLERDRVVALEEAVEELVLVDRLPFVEALGEVLSLEHARDGALGHELDQVHRRHLLEPLGVVTNLGLAAVEDLVGLLDVGLCRRAHLFARELRA